MSWAWAWRTRAKKLKVLQCLLPVACCPCSFSSCCCCCCCWCCCSDPLIKRRRAAKLANDETRLGRRRSCKLRCNCRNQQSQVGANLPQTTDRLTSDKRDAVDARQHATCGTANGQNSDKFVLQLVVVYGSRRGATNMATGALSSAKRLW